MFKLRLLHYHEYLRVSRCISGITYFVENFLMQLKRIGKILRRVALFMHSVDKLALNGVKVEAMGVQMARREEAAAERGLPLSLAVAVEGAVCTALA